MIVWVIALSLAIPAQADAKQESLAEKAAKARKPAPKASPSAPPKVFTNEDLANAKGNVIILSAPEGEAAAPPEGATEGGPEPAAKPERTEEEYRTLAGAALQKEIDRQAEIIKEANKAIQGWEAELNDITNYTFGTRRAALMQSVEDARKAIADARQSIVDLEDQARRQGIPVTVP
jgi:hypothetical protein